MNVDKKRSDAAKKAWETRNSISYKRRQAALKAWKTRRSIMLSNQ